MLLKKTVICSCSLNDTYLHLSHLHNDIVLLCTDQIHTVLYHQFVYLFNSVCVCVCVRLTVTSDGHCVVVVVGAVLNQRCFDEVIST